MRKLLAVFTILIAQQSFAWDDPFLKTTAPGYEEYVRGNNEWLAKNTREALKWFAKSSAKGNLLAGFRSSLFYLAGDGVPADTALAVKMLRLIVDAGYAPAQYTLGDLHLNGIGVKKIPEIGFRYVKLSADQGYPLGKALLARLYINGIGTPVNKKEGVLIAEREAMFGNVQCQSLLGEYYCNQTPANYDEAIKWFNMGANNSDFVCYFGLAEIYLKQENYEKVHQTIQRGRNALKNSFEDVNFGDAIFLDLEGECYLKEGKESEARRIWYNLKENYPEWVEKGKYESDSFCGMMFEKESRNEKAKGVSSNSIIVSDVDIKIPENSFSGKPIFAVIIANENYQDVAPVEYALHDGESFEKYCKKTLGIPINNIKFVANATLGNIEQQVKWLSQVMDVYQGEANIIFYYAGHGIPDEKSRTAYLLPIDAQGNDVSTGYSVQKLFNILSAKSANSVVIFMDACFTGAQRGEGMLTSARGVALKAKAEAPQGNMVVFSAASGDETAYPYKEKGHGMFTYFLLKKLQESKGDCTLQELGEYIQTNVRQQSVVINRKSQTPTVVPSAGIGDSWKTMKLK